MKLTIAAIGRIKSGPEADLVKEYVTRASRTGAAAGVTSVECIDAVESRKSDAAARKAEEGKILLGRVRDGARLVAFDERGDAVDSKSFARIIASGLESGVPEIVFAIGGPDGHGDKLRAEASSVICLGKMTWPHKLARILVAEQIYRAVTILVKHPYHRA